MAVFIVFWMTISTQKGETIDEKISNNEYKIIETKEENKIIFIEYFDKNRLVAKDFYNELGRIFKRDYYNQDQNVYSTRFFNYNENAQAIEYYDQGNNRTTQIVIPLYPVGGYA